MEGMLPGLFEGGGVGGHVWLFEGGVGGHVWYVFCSSLSNDNVTPDFMSTSTNIWMCI